MNSKILGQSIWKLRVLHSIYGQRGRNINTLCIGSTSNFLKRKDLKFCQTRSNVIIINNTLPVYGIPKTIKMETGEIIYENVYESPRSCPKISFKDNWIKKLRSEVARQAESSQSAQPKPNPIHRTGRPVVTEQTSRSSAQEIDTRFLLDYENTNLFAER